MPYITIYEKRPGRGSPSREILHTWIQLNGDPKLVYGFYPKKDRSWIDALFRVQEGRIDSAQDIERIKRGAYDAKINIYVTNEQYAIIAREINKHVPGSPTYAGNPNYRLLSQFTLDDPSDRQCTLFVNNLLEKAGVKTYLTKYRNPITQGDWIEANESPEKFDDSVRDVHLNSDFGEKNLSHLTGKTYADAGNVANDGTYSPQTDRREETTADSRERREGTGKEMAPTAGSASAQGTPATAMAAEKTDEALADRAASITAAKESPQVEIAQAATSGGEGNGDSNRTKIPTAEDAFKSLAEIHPFLQVAMEPRKTLLTGGMRNMAQDQYPAARTVLNA